MSLRRTRAQTPPTPGTVTRTCTACWHSATDLQPRRLDGFTDTPTYVCADPVACRRRAQQAGLWGAA